MDKVGRNAPCPCGSGKKYKNCCLGTPLPAERKISVIVDDQTRKQLVLINEKLLINQFTRDVPEIEASFDRLCHADMEALSKLSSQIAGLAYAGLGKATDQRDELRLECGQLIINALNTFSAAALDLRAGYLLAPGILTRNVVETLAVVAHLIMKPADLVPFQAGKFVSTDAISSAKKMIPEFGRLYGFLSGQYTHISRLHASIQVPEPYRSRAKPLNVNIALLRASLWLIYVTTELLFVDCTDSPRYWRYLGKGVCKYDPSDEEREWQKDFLTMTTMDDGPEGVEPAA